MSGHNSFFSNVDEAWYNYSSLRAKYSDAIPFPQRSYFRPIHSIDTLSELLVRPIEKPLWFAFNTLGLFIKAFLNLLASVVLTPCAILLNLVAPNSKLTRETNAAFKVAAADAIVGIGMTALTLLYTALALIFNPIYLASRILSTVVDSINSTTESCCGLTIARL
jgi:hypothetical protein